MPTDLATFHPYAMVVHQGAIVVVGVHADDPRLPGDIEVVALDAMTDIRTSETEHFELPDAFDVSSFVHGELGVAGPSPARFIVEFDARVADDVKGRRIHAQQRIATSADGRVRVSLPLVDARAAIAFILGWGDAARVVEPEWLVTEVGSILGRAASRYS
jgi:predicted DNA-binding transcriptional regulator YafY